MRVVMVVILVLLALPVGAEPVEAQIPDDHIVVHFPSKMGDVTFHHALHAQLRTNDCETCHHTHQPGEPFQDCSNCHHDRTEKAADGVEVPKASKVMHLRCKGCHEYTVKELHQPAGPTKCRLCHIK